MQILHQFQDKIYRERGLTTCPFYITSHPCYSSSVVELIIWLIHKMSSTYISSNHPLSLSLFFHLFSFLFFLSHRKSVSHVIRLSSLPCSEFPSVASDFSWRLNKIFQTLNGSNCCWCFYASFVWTWPGFLRKRCLKGQPASCVFSVTTYKSTFVWLFYDKVVRECFTWQRWQLICFSTIEKK